MAAFEAVSRVNLKPIGRDSEDLQTIDVREAKLPRDIPPKTDFDPLDHRVPKSVISPWMAYFNLIRLAFGPGMLGVPMAVSQAGIVLGPIIVLVIGILVTHTHLVLLKNLNEIARQLKISSISYRYGFRMAMYHGPPFLHVLGRFGPCIVALFMILSQLGICTVIVIFTSDNLRDIMDWEDSPAASLLCLYIPYLIMEVLMKNLKRVSYVSMGANFLNVFALSLVTYQIFMDPRGNVKYINTNSPIPIFFAFGIMLFNTSAVGVVLSCEKALKNPRLMTKKCGVIVMGIMGPSLLNAVFGCAAYYSFDSMEENVLRYLPFDEYTTLVALGVYLVAVGLSYPLQCYPGIQIFSEVIKNHDPNVSISNEAIKAFEYFSRPIFVTLTFCIAYLVPFQGPFVAFVGTLCTTMLVLIFPTLMEIGLLYPDHYGSYNWILIKDAIIVIAATIIWVVGVYLSGYLIYVRLKSRNLPTGFNKENSFYYVFIP